MSTSAAKLLIDTGKAELQVAEQKLEQQRDYIADLLKPFVKVVQAAEIELRSLTRAAQRICEHDTGSTVTTRDHYSGNHGRDIDTEYTRVCNLCGTVMEKSWSRLK